eukprot:GHVT01055497.1.p2 GENE.GHVT01055497.1~~GHVT01055497.1.p2  ORF type:complete len:111 (-),score=13.52 GHVT01055497.1:764-1096(-)
MHASICPGKPKTWAVAETANNSGPMVDPDVALSLATVLTLTAGRQDFISPARPVPTLGSPGRSSPIGPAGCNPARHPRCLVGTSGCRGSCFFEGESWPLPSEASSLGSSF